MTTSVVTVDSFQGLHSGLLTPHNCQEQHGQSVVGDAIRYKARTALEDPLANYPPVCFPFDNL